MIAALAIFSVSCSKSDSKNDTADSTKVEANKDADAKAQVKEILTQGIKDVKATPADAQKIAESVGEKLDKIANSLPEDKKQEIGKDAELTQLFMDFQTAVMSAAAPATEEVEVSEVAVEEAPAPEAEAPAM